MVRRLEISNQAFNAIRRTKREFITRKIKDKRMTKARITDAYILDIMLKKNGKL